MRVPRFKSHLKVHLQEPNIVHFISETGNRALSGDLLFQLAIYIDGNRTIEEIAALSHITEADVQLTLLLLESEGVLTDSETHPADPLSVLIDSFRGRATRMSAVSISGENDAAASLARALSNLGIPVGSRAGFKVVITDDYLNPQLEEHNRDGLRKKNPWMLLKPSGRVPWIGPVFDARNGGPCWMCLANRIRDNRAVPAPLKFPPVPSVQETAIHIAALSILKYLSGVKENSILITFDARSCEFERHAVVKMDNCAACAPRKQKSTPGKITLRSCKKTFSDDGGHRSVSADETFRNYQHHISPITGIVDAVELYRSDPNGIAHSYVAGHLFIPSLQKEALFQNGLKQISAGKGITAQQARTSALCEALERYSGVYRGIEPLIRKSYRELGEAAIHPNLCMNFSRQQYADAKNAGRATATHSTAPDPFPENRKIDWTPLWSLTHNRVRYLPASYCYYGFSQFSGQRFCRADSNGNAAGNTREEAILQGFLELVERDCASIWWYNRLRRPEVDLDGFSNPYFAAVRDYYARTGWELRVLDVTNDFRIPAFAALSENKNASTPEFLFGCGAHFDPTIALARALTEVNQFLGMSKRLLKPSQPDLEFMKPHPDLPLTTSRSYTHHFARDIRDEVNKCIRLTNKLGLDMLVLDQTRAEIGLPVVKVVVPGLRQFWRRLGKGRLYDVPVSMGWLERPFTEQQLNADSLVV